MRRREFLSEQAAKPAKPSPLAGTFQRPALLPVVATTGKQSRKATTTHETGSNSTLPPNKDEKSRVTCKERPDGKKRGSGKGRDFVPWCG
ncbi:hypothetical protein [Tortoise microvirus 46]|nr:hypothetical protein [Tortoise microvirus 46]